MLIVGMTGTGKTNLAFQIQTCLLTVAALSVPAPAAEPRAATIGSSLTIRLYNYAGVDADTLASSGESARQIYQRAGVETHWIECRTRPYQPIFDPTCQATPGPDVIRIRIMPTVPAKLRLVGDAVYGFALPSKSGGFGGATVIFWDRVAKSASLSKAAAADLLGCVMAHEAGHLLLGMDSHSAQGLMSTQWKAAEFQKIAEGSFGFVGRQEKRVARQVLVRLAAASKAKHGP